MSRPSTKLEDLPVVILSGGLGTRLKEETDRVPKPLVEIGEMPMLWHIMKLYRHYGARRFVLCLGYKSWLIKDYFLHYREHVSDFTLGGDHQPRFHTNLQEDWEITFAETGLLTATGGRLWRARDYIDTDTFMFTYGDGIGSVDISRLLEFHYEQGRLGTVTGVRPTSRYGEMTVDGTRVFEFNEKPISEGFVSGGFFVFEREFLSYLTDDPNLFFEHAPLQNLARDGELAVYAHDDFWMGMDTHRDLTELNQLWSDGSPPWRVWE